jgi:hypothetical protein
MLEALGIIQVYVPCRFALEPVQFPSRFKVACLAHCGDQRSCAQQSHARYLGNLPASLLLLLPSFDSAFHIQYICFNGIEPIQLFLDRFKQHAWHHLCQFRHALLFFCQPRLPPLSGVSQTHRAIPRSWFTCMVRNLISDDLIPCSTSMACCSSVFPATVRIPGCLTAVQIAFASAASVLLPCTKGRTNLAWISLTSFPNAISLRRHQCALPHASSAISPDSRYAINSSRSCLPNLRL